MKLKAPRITTLHVRPSIRALFIHSIPLIFISPLSGAFLGLVYAFLTNPNELENIIFIAIRIGWISVLFEVTRRYFDQVLILRHRSLNLMVGRLSLSKKLCSIPVISVTDIEIEQSLLGRLFNYGTLRIATSATNNYEIEVKFVSSPLTVVKIIEKARQGIRKTDLTRSIKNESTRSRGDIGKVRQDRATILPPQTYLG